MAPGRKEEALTSQQDMELPEQMSMVVMEAL